MYNLVQFLGFSWIFVNMTVRLVIFGQGKKKSCFLLFIPHGNPVGRIILKASLNTDSLYDTFHSMSDVMFFCQTLAVVEVLNAAFGIVRTGVIPTLVQVEIKIFEFVKIMV